MTGSTFLKRGSLGFTASEVTEDKKIILSQMLPFPFPMKNTVQYVE